MDLSTEIYYKTVGPTMKFFCFLRQIDQGLKEAGLISSKGLSCRTRQWWNKEMPSNEKDRITCMDCTYFEAKKFVSHHMSYFIYVHCSCYTAIHCKHNRVNSTFWYKIRLFTSILMGENEFSTAILKEIYPRAEWVLENRTHSNPGKYLRTYFPPMYLLCKLRL